MISLQLKNKKIIVLAHILTTVPADDLKQFLLSESVAELLFIGHPLIYKTGRPGSFLEYYQRGKLKKRIQYPNFNLPSIILYLKDFVLTLFWVLRTRKRWDYIIALDNLNTLSALLLRKMRRVKKVAYYTINFVPQRFGNQVLNNFYHAIDAFAVRHADMTWNISPRIKEGRENVRGLTGPAYARQITVPIGVWPDRTPQKKLSEIQRERLIYAGGLLPHQGIQIVLDAVPLIAKQIPSFRFVIIGMGTYEEALRRQVKKLHIEKYVEFLGYFEKHEEVEEQLARSGLAVAMYSKALDKWSYYADPSKIKAYLAAGLPVITTSLTYIANDLEIKHCGIIVDYNKVSVADAVVSLVKNETIYKKYRENAFKFVRQLSWNNIYREAFIALEKKS